MEIAHASSYHVTGPAPSHAECGPTISNVGITQQPFRNTAPHTPLSSLQNEDGVCFQPLKS